MVVLQWTVIPRVVARPQADTSPIVKSAPPCRKNTMRLGEMPTIHLKEERLGLYLGDLVKLEMAGAPKKNTYERQRNYLRQWYTPLALSP